MVTRQRKRDIKVALLVAALTPLLGPKALQVVEAVMNILT